MDRPLTHGSRTPDVGSPSQPDVMLSEDLPGEIVVRPSSDEESWQGDLEAPKPYWASLSRKRRLARLHVIGFCRYHPGQNCSAFVWGDSPEELEWSQLCSRCWRGVPGGKTPKTSNLTPDDDSSSGSSSTPSFVE